MSRAEDPVESVREAYDAVAADWARARLELREHRWLRWLTHGLPPGSSVLDFGCGNGHPVATWLCAHGHRVLGVDISGEQIKRARAAVLGATFVQADVRAFRADTPTDAAVMWDSLFHIPPGDQETVLRNLRASVRAGARAIVSAGASGGEFWAPMLGQSFYYGGLEPAQFRACAEKSGFCVEFEELDDPSGRGHLVFGLRAADIL